MVSSSIIYLLNQLGMIQLLHNQRLIVHCDLTFITMHTGLGPLKTASLAQSLTKGLKTLMK